MNKPVWHRPRIVPFNPFLHGFVVLDTKYPTVINSGDEKRKALEEQRKQRKAKQNCARVKKSRSRKRKRNPITHRIDPVSFLKAPLPYSVFKEIDAAAIKKLEGNPRDADGRPITFEEARALAIADFVRVAGKK
jgi:hypothetical protein